MSKFPPTVEQVPIREAAMRTKDNILVQALAGAAKTSTLVMIAEAIQGIPILCVAFNKRIADEMTARLPGHCSARTLNSIGHAAWGQTIGKRLTVQKAKTGDIVRDLDLTHIEQEELRDSFSDVMKLTAKAKLYGYIPDGKYDDALHLIDKETLYEVLADEEYAPIAWQLLDEILTRSIGQAFQGTIDYDDQLYMSTLFGAQMPKFPLTMVDEAQDLSPLNHQMISHLVGDRRIIAVGDHYQSIYGFRGAVSDGMSVLKSRFKMKEFSLTLSFRCPKAVIREARERAPNMKWAENAIEGKVTHLIRDSDSEVAWGANLFPRSCAVICRNNAPLFSLGLKLLRAGRGVTIRGMDISKRLIKILKEFGSYSMTREELIGHLDRWKQFKLNEGKMTEESVEDRYACLLVFAEATETLGEAIAHAERLFNAEGPIELLSGHKSKGLEWDDVFHLDPWRVPSKFAKTPEQKEQEYNLRYVITTRAKQTLTMIDLEDFDIDLKEPYLREYHGRDPRPEGDDA
jgi:DNA helicase-2/ATP-dependent DNA helicase PcrA